MMLRSKALLAGAAACCFLSGCGSATSAESENTAAKLFSKFRSSVVHIGQRIDGKSEPVWLGTGFLVDGSCTFATAKHILLPLGNTPPDLAIRVEHPDDRSQSGTGEAHVLYKGPKNDLMFLRLQSGGRWCQAPLPLASSFPGEAEAGDTTIIIGHADIFDGAKIDKPIMREGVIASVDLTDDGEPMLLLDIFGTNGLSGGPVVHVETGAVIGVVLGPGRIKRELGMQLATPITVQDYQEAIQAQAPTQ
jgi:S1-C subfamily serine protease